MPNSARPVKRYMRVVAGLLGISLLGYLIARSGSDKLVENAKSIGWGILLVLGLAGISHLIKTWAWRLTLPGKLDTVPFVRTLGLRLACEALGLFGLAGQVIGEATRASLLSSELQTSEVISSVMLDRGLFMLSGLIVMIAGLVAVVFLPAVPHALRLSAGVAGIVLLALLSLFVLAFRRGWPLLSKTARAAGRVPRLGPWLQSKESVILSTEEQLLRFHTRAPAAFWMSTLLNFVTHGLAIAEVYLILLLMGSKVTVLSALMLESLTKVINSIGSLVPGSVGTYEGGNMAIVKLVGLTGSQGLTLGLCRRFRSIFWGVIGGICLLCYSRSRKSSQRKNNLRDESESNIMPREPVKQIDESSPSFYKVAVVLATQPVSGNDLSNSLLAEVGALPLVLRAIISARNAGADRVVVVVDPGDASAIRRRLATTGRLSDSVEWLEALPESAISVAIRNVAGDAERVVLIKGDRSYQPSLYRTAMEWSVEGSALELQSGGKLVGLTTLSPELALDLLSDSESQNSSLEDVHEWIRTRHAAKFGPTILYCDAVPESTWQAVGCEQDRLAAERKLDRWLVKPTDGVFARMNRRVSIPISHQLIKFPITPNMVSLFTLGVSFTSGLYFAFGGYWNTVFGAALSLWASILDGCDGEVARLKLQSSAFGCWLDTACDYLYYLFIFAGMTIGLVRSTGRTSFLWWGVALFAGAILTFIVAGLGRKQLSGERPEQYLAVWHRKAEKHLGNPLIYIGRYTEFVVRRCFLPYALLVLAVLNFLPWTLRGSAIGANVALIISLRSYLAFSRKGGEAKPVSTSNPPATEPLTV